MKTFHTTLTITDNNTANILEQSIEIYNQLKHVLYKELTNNSKHNKPFFCQEHNITSRQYNSLLYDLKGIIKSKQELNKDYRIETELRLKDIKKDINYLDKLLSNSSIKLLKQDKINKLKTKLYYLKQKELKLTNKLNLLNKDIKNNTTRICFGSKKLFNAQFNLITNKYLDDKYNDLYLYDRSVGFKLNNKNYKKQLDKEKELLTNLLVKKTYCKMTEIETESYILDYITDKTIAFNNWLEDYKFSRNKDMFILGSSDENNGNQSCVLTYNSLTNAFNIRLRLYNNLINNPTDKYITIDNIEFPYGNELILKAIENNRALSYRIIKDKYINKSLNKEVINYKLYISFEEEKLSIKNNINTLGIDINSEHLAISVINKDGNLIYFKNIKQKISNKSSFQTKEIINLNAINIVNIANRYKADIALEDLDFKRKKMELKSSDNRHKKTYNKTLSSFAYNTTVNTIISHAEKNGIKHTSVDPKYTSMLGKINYAKRYGVSGHIAASIVIARRGGGLKNHLVNNKKALNKHNITVNILCNNRHIALDLPVRNNQEQLDRYYYRINKIINKTIINNSYKNSNVKTKGKLSGVKLIDSSKNIQSKDILLESTYLVNPYENRSHKVIEVDRK